MLTFDDCLAYAGVGDEDRKIGTLATILALRRMADATDDDRGPECTARPPAAPALKATL